MNIFVNLLFGHLVGDFLLQPKSLAVKKSASNWICTLHVLIYTLSVGIFTNFNIIWILFVFVSHWVIDRFSLADCWLKLIRGRDLPGFIKNGDLDIPDFKEKIAQEWLVEPGNDKLLEEIIRWPATEQENESRRLHYKILRGAFAALVYTTVDATFHLIGMYYFFIWFF